MNPGGSPARHLLLILEDETSVLDLPLPEILEDLSALGIDPGDSIMQAQKRAHSPILKQPVEAPAPPPPIEPVKPVAPAPPIEPVEPMRPAEPVAAPPPPPQGDGAAGGVVTTVLDLARFDRALDDGRLLRPASRRMMMTPTRSAKGETLPYGLGWYVQDHRGERLVWHSGWWEEAYSALYLKVPERGVTFIVLANSEGVWWGNPLDRAQVEDSAFARAFLETFVFRRDRH